VHRPQPRRPRLHFLDLHCRPIGVRHGPSPSWHSALPAPSRPAAGALPQHKCGWSTNQPEGRCRHVAWGTRPYAGAIRMSARSGRFPPTRLNANADPGQPGLRLVLPRRVWRERCNVPATVLTVPDLVLMLCRGASP
jgi:hypothetical protein